MPTYQDDAGAMVLHFGSGDIAICTGRRPKEAADNELVFVQQSGPREVGADSGLVGRLSNEVDTRCRMIFDKVESLDVLIYEAQLLRSQMTGGGSRPAAGPWAAGGPPEECKTSGERVLAFASYASVPELVHWSRRGWVDEGSEEAGAIEFHARITPPARSSADG